MHAHAWPLYTAAKILGLEFHSRGVSFRPGVPLPQYEFTSPLIGFKKTSRGYSGWYAPLIAGHWNIDIALSKAELAQFGQISVNGVTKKWEPADLQIRFSGESKPGVPLRWQIT